MASRTQTSTVMRHVTPRSVRTPVTGYRASARVFSGSSPVHRAHLPAILGGGVDDLLPRVDLGPGDLVVHAHDPYRARRHACVATDAALRVEDEGAALGAQITVQGVGRAGLRA